MQPAQLRALVLDLFSRIHDGRELADRALDRALRANPSLHSRERRLVSEVTFAMVRHVRRLDWQLSVALAATRQPSFETFATPEQHRLRFALAGRCWCVCALNGWQVLVCVCTEWVAGAGVCVH